MFFLRAFVCMSINHKQPLRSLASRRGSRDPLLISDELKAKSRLKIRSIYLGVIYSFAYCAGDGNQASCMVVGKQSPTELHPTVTCGF